MSAQADEPPMMAAPPGQLREWAQLGLLLADMVARRRERLGREAWNEERAAERALDRAGRTANMLLATDEECARHLQAGRWERGGLVAGRPQARVSTSFNRVDDRWVLHAVGHHGPPLGDVHAWLSCPTREHAVRIATALLTRNDPERVEILRDELNVAYERQARHTSPPGADQRTGRAGARDQNQPPGQGEPSQEPSDRGSRREDRSEREHDARAAAASMDTELRAVFDRASVAAVVADPRWPSVAREMFDARAEGHDLAAMLRSARQRLPQPLSNAAHYRSPAAYLFALLRKDRERASSREDYIDIPAPEGTPRAGSQPQPDSEGRATSAATADPSATQPPEDDRRSTGRSRETAEVIDWIRALDSEDDLDRMLAEDTVGRYGRQVDQALGEKFPGLLSPHRRPPAGGASTPPSGSPDTRSATTEDTAELSQDRAAAPTSDQARGRAPLRPQPDRSRGPDHRATPDREAASRETGRPSAPPPAADPPGPSSAESSAAVTDDSDDPHRMAAERAATLEAEGRDNAPVARASVSTTPSQAASARAMARQEPDTRRAPSPSTAPSVQAGLDTPPRSADHSKNAPTQRPPHR